jgi:hypothetical protein
VRCSSTWLRIMFLSIPHDSVPLAHPFPSHSLTICGDIFNNDGF